MRGVRLAHKSLTPILYNWPKPMGSGARVLKKPKISLTPSTQLLQNPTEH